MLNHCSLIWTEELNSLCPMNVAVMISSSQSIKIEDLNYQIEYTKELFEHLKSEHDVVKTTVINWGTIPKVLYDFTSIATDNQDFAEFKLTELKPIGKMVKILLFMFKRWEKLSRGSIKFCKFQYFQSFNCFPQWKKCSNYFYSLISLGSHYFY